jgi:hypothetical protein
MTDAFIASESEEDEAKSSASYSERDDSGSGSGDESRSVDSASESRSNSEEEPDLRRAAQIERGKKRKAPADDGTREAKRAKLATEEKEDEDDSVASGAVTLAVTQGHSRIIIHPYANTVMKLIHLVPPAPVSFAFTASGLHPGGQSVTCVLGPAAVRSVNSNAKSTTSLPCLTPIRLAHPGHGFIAGHLLNSQFGGTNTIENMTALTSSANGSQKSFDNHIVNAVLHLKSVYEELNDVGIDVMPLGYGIHISLVMDAAKWGAATPDNCISTGMTCTAMVVHIPNVDNLITVVYPPGHGLPAMWKSTRARILQLMQSVQNEVQTANKTPYINNT